jgi:methionyl-tRNA formyltransferase
MNEGLDTGDILLKTSCPIENTDTSAALHDKLLAIGGPTLSAALHQIKKHQLKPEKQNEAHSCYAPKITKAEAKIDWSMPATAIERKIRAFNPAPVCFFECDNHQVRVWHANILKEYTSARPGTILSCSKEGIQVATGENILLLQQLQLPGKKPLVISDLLNGYANWFSVGRVLN